MDRGKFWFSMDILSILLGISILFIGNFRKIVLTQSELYIDYVTICLMCIAVGFGVYCSYTRRNKILASLGVFAGILGLILSIILIF